MADEQIHIAIVGGGIGGLAFAIGLLKYKNIKITIYEAASKFSEIGGLFPPICAILHPLTSGSWCRIWFKQRARNALDFSCYWR
jgi:2-polyprenyl-6-methoxyphenol hydroxylase-like FAD-dependent oxidoreductase